MTTSTDISRRFWNLPRTGEEEAAREASIMSDEALKRKFLDFCCIYNSQPWCAGMGKDNLVACTEL